MPEDPLLKFGFARRPVDVLFGPAPKSLNRRSQEADAEDKIIQRNQLLLQQELSDAEAAGEADALVRGYYDTPAGQRGQYLNDNPQIAGSKQFDDVLRYHNATTPEPTLADRTLHRTLSLKLPPAARERMDEYMANGYDVTEAFNNAEADEEDLKNRSELVELGYDPEELGPDRLHPLKIASLKAKKKQAGGTSSKDPAMGALEDTYKMLKDEIDTSMDAEINPETSAKFKTVRDELLRRRESMFTPQQAAVTPGAAVATPAPGAAVATPAPGAAVATVVQPAATVQTPPAKVQRLAVADIGPAVPDAALISTIDDADDEVVLDAAMTEAQRRLTDLRKADLPASRVSEKIADLSNAVGRYDIAKARVASNMEYKSALAAEKSKVADAVAQVAEMTGFTPEQIVLDMENPNTSSVKVPISKMPESVRGTLKERNARWLDTTGSVLGDVVASYAGVLDKDTIPLTEAVAALTGKPFGGKFSSKEMRDAEGKRLKPESLRKFDRAGGTYDDIMKDYLREQLGVIRPTTNVAPGGVIQLSPTVTATRRS